ncbi:unnamed protein product [Prunus armeniaca]|uniref:Sacsin/Nov domain-containing protein n=1 Tax=Prunus armeniaca TaxID=36596 RepID=A0A6J5UUV7_PRUAR|nr:unnamed protein product [Prunus armeniaca]
MATPREHIEEIRMKKFSIGGELNPLSEDLHHAVEHLSAELYSKDVHFLMELIQNAEDNQYLEGVNPSLEFVITSRDVTGTGAPATLLVFNNEKGFSPTNVESICGIGRSTKKGNRNQGYIGEKGIGFKSVFLITAQPYIFSNGYQIRFNEEPCMHCDLGYIVPEWVEESPTLSDITEIYGSGSALPTTTLILPLKPDKVKPVKQQLSSMHPEVLLFLAKIKRLSVREDNEDPRLNTVTAISISSKTDFVTRKNIDADSYTLHLSAEENGNELETECSYYMWKQKFPVKQECRDEKRMEVDEWVITLAFPYGERLNRGTSSPGVYAFLPTEMFTNLPFIIQADFLLASSRENILWDKKWNQGILHCVPSAFINAFLSLVKTIEDAPVSSLPPFFRFLPVQDSRYDELNVVRDSIKAQLVEKDIVPCEPHKEQKFFHKPCEVGRLLPDFWNILIEAREVGVSLPNLSSHGKYVLCHSFDQEEYDHILSFLGVEPVDDEWYAKCIQSSNLVVGVSEDVYLELLLFIADNWWPKFLCTNIKNIPLIKYVDLDEDVSLCSLSSMQTGKKNVCLSRHSCHVSWLIDWNREFISAASLLFMPKGTQEAIQSCSNKDKLVKWLAEEMKVAAVNVHEYAVCLYKSHGIERKPAIAYAHFLYHSFCKNYISDLEIVDLCGKMPLVDNYGDVIRQRRGVIVPANESKWAGFTDSNLWKEDGFVQLGEDYMNPGRFAGQITEQKQLLEFLKDHAGASDVPYISAPNACLPAVSATLSIQKVFLLLDWIRHLRYQRVHIPEKFLKCIKEGSWLKVTLKGFSVSRPPSESFVLAPSWGNILQNGSVFVDIPLVNKNYYGERIDGYKEELKTIGVMFEFGEACEFIGKHLMSLAASSTLNRGNVLSILHFIKLLRDKCLPPDDFIRSIRKGQWLKTKSHGYRSPDGSVLFDQEWIIASKISDIPFIDREVYGEEILDFKTELELLGVVVSFNKYYQLVVDHLKSPSCLTSLAPEAVLLMLQIMHISNSSNKIVEALRGNKCLKTNNGYKSPSECLLFHPEWGCLLQVFSGVPLIDHNLYGDIIFSFSDELRRIGVVVDFEEAAKVFAHHFRQASITKENVESLLSCYRKLERTPFKFPADLKSCICKEKWLRTRLGDYRSPRECILFCSDWESLSPICRLPFIDDSDTCYGKNIHEYKQELKSLGVVVEFKDGVKFVPSCLYLPKNPRSISRENALALLDCIHILLEEKDNSFPDVFPQKVSQAWLKTDDGYRPPSRCLLFDSKFGEYLTQTDGPFIDEEFYGSEITKYREELSAIKVIVEVDKGCPLIASQLALHDELSTFVRVYSYLSEFKWEPNSKADKSIWIPMGNQNGQCVNPEECVLYDKDELFGLQLTVLEKYFEHNLLGFFSSAYKVKSRPSIDDYCKLWKVWESSETGLSHDQCCKFWGNVVSKNRNLKTEKALPEASVKVPENKSKTEKALSEALVKVPVTSGSDEIFLLNKCDVFLPDDLQLKDLFEKSSTHPLFVWYPQPSLPDLPRTTLLEMYRKIGVRAISESVQKEELSVENGVDEQVIPTEKLIGKVLLRLILGFLACPPIEMEAGTRRKAVQGLLSLTVVETTEPITVNYNLPLSSRETLNVRASRKIRWDREMSKFFTQKIDRSGGHKSIVEFATYFSQVISDGVLWEHTDHIPALSELIKLAFVLEFNEEAVDFLMKSKNLQIFIEDEEFLNSTFPSST